MPKLVFSNSGTPIRRSSSRAARCIAGLRHVCARAARLKLPCSTTAPERVQVRRAHRGESLESKLRAGAAGQLRHGVAQVAYGALDAARADLAGGSQRDAGIAARQERGAEVALHAGNGLRYGGLRDVHRPRCGTDAAEPRNFAKVYGDA